MPQLHRIPRTVLVALGTVSAAALLVAAFAIASPRSDAATLEPSAQAQPVLAELAWIAGTWREERGRDLLEERWNPPLGNAMTGTMRWLKDGQATLYEFLLLEETAEGVHLYVRHFNPGCVSWEEKDAPVALQLSEVTADSAVFTSESAFPRRYEMRKGADGVLHAVLEGEKGGKPTKLEFAYKPIAP